MHLIFFETVLLAITHDGEILIALFDGAIDDSTKKRCVALCHCSKETALGLSQQLAALLKRL